MNAGPTAVALSEFTAELVSREDGDKIVIRWRTSLELDALHFYLLQGTSRDSTTAQLITATPITATGSNSTYELSIDHDPAVDPAFDELWFWLQEVEYGGMVNTYGPARKQIDSAQGGTSIYLPLME